MHARIAIIVGLALGLASACGGDPKRRIGETCDSDGQCESGLCLESQCLDPAGDEDQDRLINRVEGELGTNALKKDSDDDGLDDFDEVGGDIANPKNFDGDAKNDALESMKRDADKDCIPDQRDPDDAVVESDAAEVADLACCCGGRCSKLGVSATAVCHPDGIVCDPAEPDRDGDGTADACDTPALALTAQEIEDGCGQACAQVANVCPGKLAGCVAECVDRAGHEGLWLANYVCYAATDCSDVKCFDDPGFGEDANCRDACVNAVGCGIGKVFGQELTEPLCRAQCAGQYHADGDSVASLECLANLAPSGTCRLVDALPCVSQDQICQDACGRLAFPPSDASCRLGSPIYDHFTTQATCVDKCLGLSGFGEVAFLGCLTGKLCSDPGTACEADPSAVAPGCDAACTALVAACPAGNGIFADASVCGAFCTGLTLAAPWITSDSASASAAVTSCIERTEACDTVQETIGVLVNCLLTSSIEPRCTTTCDRYETCAAETQRPAPPDCDLGCSGLVLNHPERIEPTLACVTADTSCDLLEGCIPPAPEDVCGPACDHIVRCNPNRIGGLVQCQADCRADIGADLDRYASWMCESQAKSCDIACGGLADVAPDAACLTECEGTDTCIEAAYGLCPRACQGVMKAYGPTTSLPCVTKNLGRRCSPTAVLACDPS
ncbi:MAG: hypothetical protein U1F43_20365 [Myxococcota bacterium]